MIPRPPRSTHLPYATLFRSDLDGPGQIVDGDAAAHAVELAIAKGQGGVVVQVLDHVCVELRVLFELDLVHAQADQDRKSTRLNSSHANISYAVLCLKTNQPF